MNFENGHDAVDKITHLFGDKKGTVAMRLVSFAFGLLLLFFTLLLLIVLPLFENQTIRPEELEVIDLPNVETKQTEKKYSFLLQEGIYQLMHAEADRLLAELGEPQRKDATAYGYHWWVYNDAEKYLLFGIADERVESIFFTGKNIASEPFTIGEKFSKIKRRFPIEERLTYYKGISHYTFILNNDDVKLQPLIQLSDDVFLQCYIDTFTNTLAAVRVISGDLLTKQRFYEMQYRGNLPPEPLLRPEDWQQIDEAMEKQIFELTNIYRSMSDVPPLSYDATVSRVAYKHSKDMYEQNYFSHDSKDGRGLKERLAEENIAYLAAGENIAAQHLDAPAVMHGWLNSEGHRETLLSDQYNYIGVGVFRQYYTQNFILQP